MQNSSQPAKCRRYDAAFSAEALRLVEQSRSTQAAAHGPNIDPKRIYKWQKEALTLVAIAGAPNWTLLRRMNCVNCGPPTVDRRKSWKVKKAITIFSVTDKL